MSSRTKTLLCLICAAPAILAGACAPPEQEPKERAKSDENASSAPPPRYAGKLRLHWNGESSSVELSPQQGRKLEALAAELVATTSTVMRLAVTPELMRGYYAKSRSAELIYPAPRNLELGFGEQSIEPERLFFMLEGELTDPEGDGLVVLHGYPEYSAGPLVIPEGRQRLGALLAALRN